ncbi:Alanine dehydrogenase [compost metagenome]
MTTPYGLQIANKGWKRAAQENAAIAKGVNTFGGKIIYPAVAEAQGLAFTAIGDLLAD